MAIEDNEWSIGAVAVAFLAGALIGAGAALLLAPQSGAKTRKLLKDYAEKAQDETLERVQQTKSALDSVIEKGQEFVREKKALLSSAS
jgi:gas vesicle protein